MPTVTALRRLIDTQQHVTYREPEKASNADALGILVAGILVAGILVAGILVAGILVAHRAQWDGDLIVEAFLAAREDANYHSLYEKVEAAWTEDQAEQVTDE